MERMSQNDLARINENIKKIQNKKNYDDDKNEVDYDILGITKAAHQNNKKINEVILREF